VYGTGDDNVHPQNSVMLVQRLEYARKPFSVMLFPNKTHALAGRGGTLPLFDKLEGFIRNNL
jgi:dipeptidyl-peptidase-4